jgi:drug/metabolite transporter (DMT)-like permease
MQPFYAVLFAMFLINEQPNWQTIVGGLLVISAAVYETINTHRENRKDK